MEHFTATLCKRVLPGEEEITDEHTIGESLTVEAGSLYELWCVVCVQCPPDMWVRVISWGAFKNVGPLILFVRKHTLAQGEDIDYHKYWDHSLYKIFGQRGFRDVDQLRSEAAEATEAAQAATLRLV